MKPWYSQWHGLQTPKPVKGTCGAEARAFVSARAAELKVPMHELMSARRYRAVAHPRQQIMAELYATGRYSLPAIGRLFGRDHATVLHAVRKVAERMGEGA